MNTLILRATVTGLALACTLALAFASPAARAQTNSVSAVQYALIVQDHVSLRNAPRDSAVQQAQLWQGELVELRGER